VCSTRIRRLGESVWAKMSRTVPNHDDDDDGLSFIIVPNHLPAGLSRMRAAVMLCFGEGIYNNSSITGVELTGKLNCSIQSDVQVVS